jgi:acetylornithine deacetylase/succinyl-diaminopimelate desuccinylase family protein
MADDDLRARLWERSGDLAEETTDFLREMVRTESVNPPGDYAAVADLLTETYEGYGWRVERADAPASLLDDLDLPHPRPNVLAYANEGAEDGPTVVFNAHFDTVPVEADDWTFDPFGAEVENGRLYGRGANDSKGRIASYTLALRALSAADAVPEDATLALAITADEETGGHAGAGYVASEVIQPDYAVVEGSSESIWNAACGVLHVRVDVSGTAAHAGSPDGGDNAVVAAGRLVAALDDYADELAARGSDVEGVDGPTCTPATVEGGRKTNIVPASCSFTVDRRVTPDEDPDDAEAELRERVAAAAAAIDDDVDVSVTTLLRADPYYFDPEDAHVRAVKENADAMLDREVPVAGTQGFTDARFFADAGAACVHFGPGDSESNAHGADESVALDQVREAGAVLAATARDLGRSDPA